MGLDDTKTLAERILRLEQKLQRLEKREGRPSVELFDNSAIRNRKIIDDLLVHNHTHANLSGLDADDHTQYLNTTRHDVTDRHTLGTVVPHDSHSSLSNLSNDDHTQYLNTTRHDTTDRHTLGTVVPHDDHGSLSGLADDDHAQYLNTTRHDTTDRHTLGTVVPHDSHSSLSNLSNDDHTQYLNETRHDTTDRHALGTVVPHDDHGLLSGLDDDDHTQYTKHPASSTDNAIARWDGTDGDKLQNSVIKIDDNGKFSGDALDGWIYDTDTWTYVSATSFKIAGKNVAYRFPKGTKIKLVQSGSTKYFYVTAATFSTDTTVTVTGGSDYTLANENISGQAYSYAAAPQGFPLGTSTFVPLTTPLTSTDWDGDTKTTADRAIVDLSAVFGVPAGVKAVLMTIQTQCDTVNEYIRFGPNSTYNYALICRTPVASQIAHAMGIVPCDSNGDVYCYPSGTIENVQVYIWGYWL